MGQVTKVKLICWFYKNEPAWCTVVHGIAKSRTRLSDQSELRIKEDPKLFSLDNEVRGNITFKAGSSNSISQSESFSLLSTVTVPNFSLQFTKLSYSQQIILPPTLLRNHCTLASLFLKLSSLFTPVSKEIYFLSFLIFTVCHPEMFPQSYQASNSSFLLLWDVELLKRISYFQAHFFSTISSSPPLWSPIWLLPTLLTHLCDMCSCLQIQNFFNSSTLASQQPLTVWITSFLKLLLRLPLLYTFLISLSY